MNVKAGTMVIANLNLWHGGSQNISGKPRKMIMINIKRRNLPYEKLIMYTKSRQNNGNNTNDLAAEFII